MSERIAGKERRDLIDREVLHALGTRGGTATSHIWGIINFPGRPLYGTDVTTAEVLRSCRRLMRHGLVEPADQGPYRVMLSWRATQAGRTPTATRIGGEG